MNSDAASAPNNASLRKVLVAGATGHLGAQVLGELRARGYWTRALVRDAQKAQALSGMADNVVTGDVTRPETLSAACEGVDAIFSAVGASLSLKRTKERASYRETDYAGNKNLLRAAQAAGVQKFIYVSVFNEGLPVGLEYIEAHEDFVRELEKSGMAHTVVRPTGFFSAFAEMVEMARRGPVPVIGTGEARVNPIHEQDLARHCVDALESDVREVAVGGPETLTRREITALAFKALDKKRLMVSVPARVFQMLLPLIGLYDRRLQSLFAFFVAVNQTDAVAPPHGTRRLEDFFREIAARHGARAA